MNRMRPVTIFVVSLGFFYFVLRLYFLGFKLHEYYAPTKLLFSGVTTVVTKEDINTVHRSEHDNMSSLTSTSTSTSASTPNLTLDIAVNVTEISNNNVNNEFRLEESLVGTLEEHQVPQQQRPVKFFAIHIGPSKTGTSAIQKDLSCIPFTANTTGEDQDRVIYVGKTYSKHGCRKGTIRNIHGHAISPQQEHKMYRGVKKCVQKLMSDYYHQESSNDSDRAALDQRLETDEETRASLRHTLIETCFNNSFRYLLDYSIVDSDEAYSYKSSGKTLLARRFRAFDILGYQRLVVVGAYRRYADWLVSAYTESIQSPCLKPNLEGMRKTTVCASLEDFLHTNLDRNDKSNFFSLRKDKNIWYNNIDQTIPHIVEAGPSHLEAKILNYFQLPTKAGMNTSSLRQNQSIIVKTYDSITTELYCEVLGMELMPHTCRQSQKRVEQLGSNDPPLQGLRTTASDATTVSVVTTAAGSLVQNQGTTSDAVYQSIVAAGYRFGFLLPTPEEISVNKQPCLQSKKHFWCDEMQACLRDKKENCTLAGQARRAEIHHITAGGTFTIVGSNSSNITMWQDLSRYHTEVHRLSWTQSLPVRCPSRKALEKLLKRSLAFEELVMPEFSASPLGRKEHTRLFWDVWLEEQKLFCWVDIPQLFQNATSWDEIIHDRMVVVKDNDNRNNVVTYGATEEV